MKKYLFGAALLLISSSAFAAETIKATVGHMCCGGCKAAATAGVKKLDWVDAVAIDGTAVTITAKGDQKVDVVALRDALSKSGFPAAEILVSGPVTMTVGHLCCPMCTNDMKTKLAEVRSQVLDKDNIKIDQASKTVVLQPLAGKQLNLVSLLNQMDRAGFSAVKCTVSAAAATTARK
jgi:copper chaperone CopZ